MLHEIESRITAVIADGVKTRPIDVLQVPAETQPSAAGRGVIRVSLAEITPEVGFERDQFVFPTKTSTRRVLPLRFKAAVEFFRQPQGNTAEQLTQARRALLEDVSLVSHNLSAGNIRDGTAFRPAAPDPGFEVLSFELNRGAAARLLGNGLVSAELEYGGGATIWPPGISEEGGPILTIEAITTALPLSLISSPEIVLAGGSAQIRVRGANPRRSIAVTVLSDRPPAQRGTITSGDAGAETGFRIVQVTAPETIVNYQAPAGDLGTTRVEYVALHLATPDNRTGLFLGSVAVRLQPPGGGV